MKKFITTVLLAAALFAAGRQAALDRFIQAPDANFRYALAKTVPGDGYTTYVLDLTSQA
jgi:hypothetical protein